MSAPNEMSGIVAPWLLGPLNEPQLENDVQMTQGRTAFRFDQASAVLNHGVVSTETGELGYLVDIDAFREGGRAYNSPDILAHSAILHTVALGLFQHSFTYEVLKMMRSASTSESR